MTTIVLLVSRPDFLKRVITAIELQECDAEQTNLLAIVDGDDELYVKTRNLVNLTKYNNRLVVRSNYPGHISNLDIPTRRARIAANHNQAKELIVHNDGYVFCVEDDTTFGRQSLKKLTRVMDLNRAAGFVEGVELGRWGVPYVGAWLVDDIYDPKQITSIPNIQPNELEDNISNIDAGGLYCALIRADLYKQHTFVGDNGLGPDINFGIETRQAGFENFIAWNVPCTHITKVMGVEESIKTNMPTKIITMTKKNDTKWLVSY